MLVRTFVLQWIVAKADEICFAELAEKQTIPRAFFAEVTLLMVSRSSAMSDAEYQSSLRALLEKS